VNAQPSNITSTIFKNVGEDLSATIDALKNYNVTGAVNEVFYFEMLGIPCNSIIDGNEMLR
jgi:hypothetical protein